MEVINELKELDSLHNEWKTVGTKISNEELSSEISGESDRDLFYFEGSVSRFRYKEQGCFNDECK